MANSLHIHAAYLTDQGRVRDHNEDYVILRPPTDATDEQVNGWVAIVADGVGGAEAGEVASQYAAQQTINHYLTPATPTTDNNHDWGTRLKEAVMAAHVDLCGLIETRQANVTQQTRMGTTIVAAVIQGNKAYLANVGDSRGYHLRRSELRQITKDHSLVMRLLDEGLITQEDANTLRIGNIILQSIGSEQPPQIDIFPLTLQPGDMLLLCSDGLNNHVPDADIATILAQNSPEEACRLLVALANEHGGHDNITTLVMHCV
jgi:PPM family protein phosphatase